MKKQHIKPQDTIPDEFITKRICEDYYAMEQRLEKLIKYAKSLEALKENYEALQVKHKNLIKSFKLQEIAYLKRKTMLKEAQFEIKRLEGVIKELGGAANE